jgi:DNA-binding NtrC family response regulator
MQHTILLVDDEPILTEGLKRVLFKEPYVIISATSAEEALQILKTQAVDVVVSDQGMPGMTGTEFLSIVHSKYPDTIRFMLTGQATLEVAIQAINEGSISRFFTKPCNNFDLAVTIRQALQYKDLITESKRLLQVTRLQSAIIGSLEQEHPGITRVNKDAEGAFTLELDAYDHDTLIQEICKHVDNVEQHQNNNKEPG